MATSADALSSGWVREEPVGLAGRWKCTQVLFSAELNQSKRNQHTRRIEVASCHVCARSALLVLRASNNFDTRLCGLCCMVQEKHSLMTDCCVTFVMHKPSFGISSSLPFRFHDVIHMPRSDKSRTRSEGGQHVCRFSGCPSRAEQMTHATFWWSCARYPDASPVRRTRRSPRGISHSSMFWVLGLRRPVSR